MVNTRKGDNEMKNEALEVLKNRRAIRKFKSEQIKPEELDAVLEAGTFAPTGMGKQSPLIVAVQNSEKVNLIKKMNAEILGTDTDPYYGAPTILLVFSTEIAYDPEIGILDAASVCVNLLNAAYAAGLGSCWIHRAKNMFESENGKAVLREWGLPDNLRGVCSIALGYADCEHPVPRPRRDGYVVKL